MQVSEYKFPLLYKRISELFGIYNIIIRFQSQLRLVIYFEFGGKTLTRQV